jgi:membrane-associated protein
MIADALGTILNMLDQVTLQWLCLTVFLFTTLETSLLVGLLVPGDVVVLAAGAATNNFQETIIVIVFAALGTLVGQTIGYVIGRKIGPHIQSSFLKRWITPNHWAQAEALLTKRAGLGILAAQFLPVVHATLPVAAGIIKLRYRRFALWAGSGSVLWAIIYVSAGSLFGQTARSNPSHIGWLSLVAIGLIISLWFIGYVIDKIVLRSNRAIRRRKNRQ